MTTQHTPTPWAWGEVEGNEALLGANGEPVLQDYYYEGMWFVTGRDKANKAHIVRCVNAHDAMLECVAALRKQTEWLDATVKLLGFVPRPNASVDDAAQSSANYHGAKYLLDAIEGGRAQVLAARAALAKVAP